MRRVLAVTAALVLLLSLVGPAVLADRGGNGGGRGVNPQPQGPAGEPGPGPSGVQTQEQAQDRDGDDDCEGPIQERKQDSKDEAEGMQERSRIEASGEDAPKPGNGNGPETPPGQAVSAAVRSRFSTEGESTGNTHRVQVQTQLEPPGDVGGEGDDEPQSLEQRILKWQRKVLQSARRIDKSNNGIKPFMLVGQAVYADGSLTVEPWKGNQLVRDYLAGSGESTITITPTSEIRLIDAGGVTTCTATLEECLSEWVTEDNYVSVWGRVELDENGNEVFVAYRITVTVPVMECEACDLDPEE